MPIHRVSPTFLEQDTSVHVLETGVKVIDLLVPFPRGGKMGMFGGAGVGKTVVMMEMIHNIARITVEFRFLPVLVKRTVKEMTFIVKCWNPALLNRQL